MATLTDPVADPKGLLPPTHTDVSEPKPLVLSEEDTVGRSVESREARKTIEANTVRDGYWFIPDDYELIADSVGKSFTSGGNWAYTVYKRFEREAMSPPPDPSFKPAEFIARNRELIPANLELQFHLATSETNAQLTLKQMRDELAKQDVLERRHGFSTFVASTIAGLVDLDTPLAIFSGGLSSGLKTGLNSTKWGRMTQGAVGGGLTNMLGQTLAVNASTTDDWTSIPVAGLGGMALGTLGGMRSHTPEVRTNDSIGRVIDEFDEAVRDGVPLASHDIRTEAHTHADPYGSVAAHDKANETIAKAEAAEKATDTGGARVETAEKLDPEELKAAHERVNAVYADDPIDSQHTGRKPQVFRLDELQIIPDSHGEGLTARDIQGEGSSVGARQLNPQGSAASIESEAIRDIVNAAKSRIRKIGFVNDYFAKDSNLQGRGAVADAVHRAAVRFHDILAASPIATDFDRFMRSGSAVAQTLAYDLMESASGIVRNNRSAAMLKDWYEKRLLGQFMPHYEDSFKVWSRDNGVSWYEQLTNSAHREKFNREVIEELQRRAFAPNDPATPHQSVKLAADAHDAWSALDVEIAKGRPGEGTVRGYENVKAYSGYFPQRWSGENIEKLIRSGRKKEEIIDAISEAYVQKHGISKRDADVWAAAVVRRSRASYRGTDMNLIGILQQDGREFLRQVLHDNGIPHAEADKLIDKLTGEAATRGQAGHTKGRIDVDLRTVTSNGIKLLDLVETDLARTVGYRSRGTAGASALARKGIMARTDRNTIKEAILQEQAARGQSQQAGVGVHGKVNDFIDKDKHLTARDIDDFFSYFDAGPVASAGRDADTLNRMQMISNVKKLTNLALLNKLGLTQMAEMGVQMASVGVKRWFKHAGEQLRGNALNPRSELNKELRHMSVMVPEERLFRDDLNLELERTGPGSSELAQKVSHLLNMGQRLQGYTSGFYAMKNFQQRVAVTSAVDKIMQNMAGLAKDFSADRAADIGLDPKLYARIAKQYANPPVGKKKRKSSIVEFRDGSVHKLNLDKWDPDDAEAFIIAINRHVNQTVQKAMIGESSLLFHRDGVASLFTHLKSFTMLALEKQAYRNLRIADTEALSGFMMGLGTAAVAYMIRQVVDGNDQNLSFGKIAKGAVGYSNMTGWLPMWSDPLATMFGMENMKFNAYSRGIDGNVFGAPAALTTMNRMANIPAVPVHALSGEFSNNDVRALQTTPIIGGAYGMTWLLNQLKE